MPSNNVVPRRQLSTWDKVSLYALDSLPRHRTWFTIAEIKEKARSLIATGSIASVSSNPGAVSAVNSCLNRMAVLGIVFRDRDTIGGRGQVVYELNRSRAAVAELAEAINDELLNNRNLDSSFWRANNCYFVLYSVWQEEQEQEQEHLLPNGIIIYNNNINYNSVIQSNYEYNNNNNITNASVRHERNAQECREHNAQEYHSAQEYRIASLSHGMEPYDAAYATRRRATAIAAQSDLNTIYAKKRQQALDALEMLQVATN